MQLGIICGSGVAVSGAENPAFIVYAPLSITSVLDGGTGPEDLVFRWLGAIVVDSQERELVAVLLFRWKRSRRC